MEVILKAKYKIFLALSYALLFLLSVFPRAVELISGNYIFLLDQGRDYLAIQNIVVGHKLTLIGSEIGGGYAGFSGIFQGPFHYYFLSIPFLLSGGDPYSGIVYTFFVNILAIIASFVFGQKVFGKPWGLVLSLLFAISPPLISASRYVWNPHTTPLLVTLAFIFIFLSYKKKTKHIFLAGFLSAFTYNFEVAITVPLVISLVFYSIFVLRVKLKNLAVLFISIILGVLPTILFEIRHNFNATRGLIDYLSTPYSSNNYGLINNHIDSFIHNLKDTFPHNPITFTPLFVSLFLLLVFYLFKSEKKREIKSLLIFFAILIVVTIGIFSFLRNTMFMYYLIDLNVVYITLFTYVVYRAFLDKNLLLKVVSGTVLLLLVIYASVSAFKVTNYDISDYGGISKVKGKMDAIDYIYKDAKGKPFGLFIFAPTVYTDPYDYLIVWQGEKKYHYTPSKSKDGLFYLLIEPDQYKPWAAKGWMETVIKDGKVINTITLKSGFIIQKRIGE